MRLFLLTFHFCALFVKSPSVFFNYIIVRIVFAYFNITTRVRTLITFFATTENHCSGNEDKDNVFHCFEFDNKYNDNL